MDARSQRQLGMRLAARAKASATQAVVANASSDYAVIFDTASSELGLDALVVNILQGPSEWAYQALRHIRNLSPSHRDQLIAHAACDQVCALNTLRNVPELGTHKGRIVAAAGGLAQSQGSITGFQLYNAGGYNCEFTMYWTDNGLTQPAAGSAAGDWKWSNRLLAAMTGQLGCNDFVLPKSPLQPGDDVWMYLWVEAGQDIETPLRFTYDPTTTNVACFTSSGTTQCDSLTLNQITQGAQSLSLYMQSQQQSKWCWSAVSVSISLFYNSASFWTQCMLVNMSFNLTTCCQDGSTAACNKTNSISAPLTTTGNLASSEGALSFQPIAAEINVGRPIAVGIYWFTVGGHVVAISGYDDTTPSDPQIDIEDPWSGSSTQDFNSFPATYSGGGTWVSSCLTKP